MRSIALAAAVTAILVATPAAAGAQRLSPGIGDIVASPAAPAVGTAAARPNNGKDICLFGPERCGPGLKLNGWKVPEAPSSPACSKHFCIHWVADTGNAPNPADHDGNGAPFAGPARGDEDGIPDYVEEIAVVAERTWDVEVGRLGWRRPEPDRGRGGDDRTDMYLFAFDRIPDYAGLAVSDGVDGRPLRQRSGYILIDDDYHDSYYEGSSPRRVLEQFVPHEFNHLIQFSYDGYLEHWMWEATADWMASVVYPHPRYFAFVDPLVDTTTQPLTRLGFRSYVLSLWNAWLARRHGPEVVRRAWEVATRFPRHVPHSLRSYDLAIRERSRGRSSFAEEFAGFAAATAEWSERDFDAADASKDLARLGELELDGPPERRRMNRASWALYDVERDGDARRYTARAEVERGVPAAVALVGLRRDGGSRRAVVRIGPDGEGRVTLRAPRAGFKRLTAVLVNTHMRGRNYGCDQGPCEVRAKPRFTLKLG